MLFQGFAEVLWDNKLHVKAINYIYVAFYWIFWIKQDALDLKTPSQTEVHHKSREMRDVFWKIEVSIYESSLMMVI